MTSSLHGHGRFWQAVPMPETTPDLLPSGIEPEPGVLTAAARNVRVLLAPNPGPMSLRGTQSYVIGTDGACVVVDPGPEDQEHLAALAALRPSLVLVTHRHADHTEGVDRLHELTGAPVRAASGEFCREAEPLHDGEVLVADGVAIHVLATPGHTSDSCCFHVPGAEGGSLLSGDTILGTGTTMLDHPDGTLSDYLNTLERLALLAESAGAPVTLLPAHGGLGGELGVVVRQYREHRLARLAEVRQAVATVGDDAGAVTAVVYPDVPEGVRRAARLSIEAQLRYLRERPDR